MCDSRASLSCPEKERQRGVVSHLRSRSKCVRAGLKLEPRPLDCVSSALPGCLTAVPRGLMATWTAVPQLTLAGTARGSSCPRSHSACRQAVPRLTHCTELREGEWCVQRHTACERQSQGPNPCCLAPRP